MFLSLYQLIRMIHYCVYHFIISKQCEISVIPFIRKQEQKSAIYRLGSNQLIRWWSLFGV